jgi:hypothetical protein
MKRNLRMSKFEIGDKVRLAKPVREPDVKYWSGTLIVEQLWHDGSYSCVKEAGSVSGYFSEDELEHVEATPIPADFRFFRRTDGAISEVPYPTFEAALEGWRGFAQNGDQTEIVELISHGTYKATLKVEVVEPITEGA